MTIAFTGSNDGTKVTVDHRMSGEFPGEHITGFVEEGWLDGLTKLKSPIEK